MDLGLGSKIGRQEQQWLETHNDGCRKAPYAQALIAVDLLEYSRLKKEEHEEM